MLHLAMLSIIFLKKETQLAYVTKNTHFSTLVSRFLARPKCYTITFDFFCSFRPCWQMSRCDRHKAWSPQSNPEGLRCCHFLSNVYITQWLIADRKKRPDFQWFAGLLPSELFFTKCAFPGTKTYEIVDQYFIFSYVYDVKRSC